MKTQTIFYAAAAFGLGYLLFKKKPAETLTLPTPTVDNGGLVVQPGFVPSDTAPKVPTFYAPPTPNPFNTTTGISGL